VTPRWWDREDVALLEERMRRREPPAGARVQIHAVTRVPLDVAASIATLIRLDIKARARDAGRET
jgi:hypothetical protein